MNETQSTNLLDSLSLSTNTNQLHPKATIEFKQPVSSFFYHQNHILCKCKKKIIIYSTLTKKIQTIEVATENYILEQLPPYLAVIMEGQYLKLYPQEEEKQYIAKISKMEPLAICRYNKGCFLGGYNRSILPGGKHSTRRSIYFIEKLSFTNKNTPDNNIKLKQSSFPVSHLRMQNPYLIAYCQPVLYMISIFSLEIVLTFQKQATDLLVLQGRYATSCLNGFGISIKKTIFTFDVERFPLYGVQINQHLQQCQCICLQRTGRIFAGRGNSVFQYNPIKRSTKCWIVYSENERVIWISCTPSNNLMVLHGNNSYVIEVYNLE